MSKRSCWIVSAAAAVAFPGFALAQDTPPPPAPDRSAELLTRYDANADGKITRDEVTAVAQKTITDGDANADGVLSVEEHQAAQSSTRFKALDKDGDGAVSLEEFKQQPQGRGGRGSGGGRDQDGDGALSIDELSGMMTRLFDMADADQNGELSGDELAQAPMGGRGGPGGGGGGEGRGGPGGGGGEGRGGGGEGRQRPTPEETFQRLDTDANGSLSQAELDAMRGPGGRRGGRRGGEQGGGAQEPETGKVY